MTMRAAVLTKFGDSKDAFKIQERPIPTAQANEICIKVQAFGLNFADVMARQGLYQDCPPLPAVLGYEVVGHIHAIGSEVKGFELGQRVVALTHFGGYAEYAVADPRVTVVIDEEMDDAVATSLATQYATAYYCAAYTTQLHEGEHVLIQAAAGGVGTALVQLAKHKGCIVYGTAGSEKKLDYLRSLGVDYPINYNKDDFADYIKKQAGERPLDVVFDSLGGKAVKKARKLLNIGTGRIVCYGVASRSGKGKGIFNDLKLVAGFGFLANVQLLLQSQGITGVNMLRIADNRPETIKFCMESVVKLVREGVLNPTVGGKFGIDELAAAHDFLGGRTSIGKVAVHW